MEKNGKENQFSIAHPELRETPKQIPGDLKDMMSKVQSIDLETIKDEHTKRAVHTFQELVESGAILEARKQFFTLPKTIRQGYQWEELQPIIEQLPTRHKIYKENAAAGLSYSTVGTLDGSLSFADSSQEGALSYVPEGEQGQMLVRKEKKEGFLSNFLSRLSRFFGRTK